MALLLYVSPSLRTVSIRLIISFRSNQRHYNSSISVRRLVCPKLWVPLNVCKPLVSQVLSTGKIGMFEYLRHCETIFTVFLRAHLYQIVEISRSILAYEITFCWIWNCFKERTSLELDERRMPSGSFVHEAPERPNINLFGIESCVQYLRSYPIICTNFGLSVRLLFGHANCTIKICNLNLSLLVIKDVVWFYIPVNDAKLVQGVGTLSHLPQRVLDEFFRVLLIELFKDLCDFLTIHLV